MEQPPDFLVIPIAPPRTPKSRVRWWAFIAIGVVVLLAITAFVTYLGWKRKLPPAGGIYFIRAVELPVPLFRQSDENWRFDLLGPTEGTMGAEGCAVTSAAMVMKFYGIDTDPKRLNEFLTSNEGYTPQGWLYWEKAAEFSPGHVEKAYEDLPSYWLIDSNLLRGNPVIIRLRLSSGVTHFVVIAGKRGFDYLIRDPGAGSSKGMYPLREFGSEIEALRFYRKL